MDRRPAELLCDDEGATAVEYAILASLIAVVIAAAVGLLGQRVAGIFSNFTGLVNW